MTKPDTESRYPDPPESVGALIVQLLEAVTVMSCTEPSPAIVVGLGEQAPPRLKVVVEPVLDSVSFRGRVTVETEASWTASEITTSECDPLQLQETLVLLWVVETTLKAVVRQ